MTGWSVLLFSTWQHIILLSITFKLSSVDLLLKTWKWWTEKNTTTDSDGRNESLALPRYDGPLQKIRYISLNLIQLKTIGLANFTSTVFTYMSI